MYKWLKKRIERKNVLFGKYTSKTLSKSRNLDFWPQEGVKIFLRILENFILGKRDRGRP